VPPHHAVERDLIADGRIVCMLNRMPESSAAYDWMPTLIRSEGALGVITRAVL
jgi:FAD/FMN-containing dehydrogenase